MAVIFGDILLILFFLAPPKLMVPFPTVLALSIQTDVSGLLINQLPNMHKLVYQLANNLLLIPQPLALTFLSFHLLQTIVPGAIITSFRIALRIPPCILFLTVVFLLYLKIRLLLLLLVFQVNLLLSATGILVGDQLEVLLLDHVAVVDVLD